MEYRLRGARWKSRRKECRLESGQLESVQAGKTAGRVQGMQGYFTGWRREHGEERGEMTSSAEGQMMSNALWRLFLFVMFVTGQLLVRICLTCDLFVDALCRFLLK